MTPKTIIESLPLLEINFAEFKELTQVRLIKPSSSSIQQLKEEIQQIKIETDVNLRPQKDTEGRIYEAVCACFQALIVHKD